MTSSTDNCSNGTKHATGTLPVGYVPTERDCIVGRGKRHRFHKGNLRFRCFVQDEMTAYKAAQSKAEKSAVISRVMDRVRADGAFIRHISSTGRWSYVEEHAVSQADEMEVKNFGTEQTSHATFSFSLYWSTGPNNNCSALPRCTLRKIL